jgi:hypothetical protein
MFVASLDRKTAGKVLYNIDLSEQTNDPALFKKLRDEIWNSEQDIKVYKFGCLHFGIKRISNKPLFLPRMALLRKLQRSL